MQLLTFLFLGVGIPILLVLLQITSWKWLAMGAIAWTGALIAKIILGYFVAHLSHRCFSSEKVKAALWGTWSALCELGIAAIIFLFIPLALEDVIGFGIGAGAIEVLYILVISIIKEIEQPQASPKDKSSDWISVWGGVIERAITLAGHLCSRGIVWIGLKSWPAMPLVIAAVLLFALVDGVATYGVAVGWDWSDMTLYRKFLGFLFIVGIIEAILFVIGIMFI